MQKKPLKGVYDVWECNDCGWISPEHMAEFLKFVKTLNREKIKEVDNFI